MTLKAFVYDHGWDGAEIFFSESRDKAVQWLQDRYVPLYQERVDQHDETRSGRNIWIPSLEYWKNRETVNSVIKEFELFEGFYIETSGE